MSTTKSKNSDGFLPRLNSLIDQSGISKAHLARELGVSNAHVANWLAGQMPRAEHLLPIARHFNVTMEWLLSGQDAEPRGKGGPGNAPIFNRGLGAATRIAKATSLEEEAKDYRNLAAKLQKRVDKLNANIADLIKQAEWCDDFAQSVLEDDDDEDEEDDY